MLLNDGTPYYPFSPLPGAFISALQEELRAGVDLVQAEFAEMLPLRSWLPAEIPSVFIHHQIHHIYVQRTMEAHGHHPYSEYLARWMADQERLYLRQYDAVVAFSEDDRRFLEDWAGLKQVFTSAFPVPADVGFAASPAERPDGRFLFLGGEEHGANRAGLKWLLREIWPEIHRQRPGSELQVIGRWSESWKALHQGPQVRYLGFVDDLGKAMHGGTMIVPLQVGSGIRTKILAALAQGVPVVTTSVGVEGVALRPGTEILVADRPAEIAATCTNLIGNEALWQRVSRAGQAAVKSTYSAPEVRKRRNEIYRAVCANRSQALSIA